MKHLQRIVTAIAVLLSGVIIHSQGGAPTRFVTPPAQVIAIRAGRMFDSRAGTVLPGMIDAHVHLYPADNLPEATRTIVALANAQTDLNAGFTTVLDMDTRG